MLTEGEIPRGNLMTIGVDFKLKMLSIDGNQIKGHIWDTAGQESFNTIVSSYYNGAIGAMVFFDLSHLDSLHSCDKWIGVFLAKRDPHPSKIVMVGNKCDMLDAQKIDSVTIINYIENLNAKYNIKIHYTECSSRNNIGVQQTLEKLVHTIYRSWPINKNKKNGIWSRKQPIISRLYPVGIRICKEKTRYHWSCIN